MTLELPRINRTLTERVKQVVGPERAIGPVGTVSRITVGVLAIALPIFLGGLTWWDAGAAFVGYPLLVAVAAGIITSAYARLDPAALERRESICSGPACAIWFVIVAIAIAASALTPVTAVALFVWVGASMLLTAVAGYGGCEVLAFPNLIAGRRDQVGCLLFTPIDRWEARSQGRGAPHRPRHASRAAPRASRMNQ